MNRAPRLSAKSHPDGPPSAGRSPMTPSGRTILPYEPEPLDIRVVRRREPPDGAGATGIYRVWDAGEGSRCRLCPRDLCTLKAVERRPDVATCFVLVQGDPLPGIPSAVSFRD